MIRPTSLFFVALVMTLLFLSSCSDDGPGNLNVNYKMTYQGVPLVIGQEYQYDGKTIVFQRVSFFASDIRGKGDGSVVLKEAEYIDLTDSHKTMELAQSGQTYTFTDLPADSYTGLSYNIGVTESQNTTLPSDYTADNVLSLSSEHWADWNSYIFVKIEAQMDLNGDGEIKPVRMHLGSDAARRLVDLDQSYVIEEDQTSTINVGIDVFNIFVQDGIPYDFSAVPVTHSLSFIDQINFVATGLQTATIAN